MNVVIIGRILVLKVRIILTHARDNLDMRTRKEYKINVRNIDLCLFKVVEGTVLLFHCSIMSSHRYVLVFLMANLYC